MTTKENVLNEILNLNYQLTINGNLVKYDIEHNTLAYGYTRNAEFVQCGGIEYNLNESLDANLDALGDLIVNSEIDALESMYCDVGHC